jgi:vitamin B12 transporter
MKSTSVDDKNLDTFGVFAQQVVKYRGVDSTFNVRYDNSSYGNDFITYRLGLSKMFAQSFKIQTSFSTATKNPTLYQLYSSFGNPALKEETQKGGNIALSYHWSHGKIKWNYFNYSLKNLIDYNFTTSKYYNNGEADRKGYEVDISHKFSLLTLSANYTYLIATLEDGSYQLRRPRHQASIAATHSCDRMSFSLITNYIGTRGAYPTGSLPGFVKLDLRTKYNFNKKTSLSLQWNNILNHQYEMIKGYQTEGSSLYGKLTYQF